MKVKVTHNPVTLSKCDVTQEHFFRIYGQGLPDNVALIYLLVAVSIMPVLPLVYFLSSTFNIYFRSVHFTIRL